MPSGSKSPTGSFKSESKGLDPKPKLKPQKSVRSLNSRSSDTISFPSLKRAKTRRSASKEAIGSSSENLSQPAKVEEHEWQNVFKNQGLFYSEETDEVHWVDSERFNLVIGMIVAINCIVIGIDTDVNSGIDGRRPGVIWQIVDTIFAIIWVSEVIVRFYYHRCRYFCSSWNLLDFFLACLAVMDAWVMKLLEMDSSSQATESFSWYRVIRIARMLRLLRLIKLMRMIQEVWLIIQGFLEALRTLVWVFVLLFIVIFCSAVYMTAIVGQTCDMDYRQAGIEFDDCELLFGKVPNSMLTLFQMITLDAWSEVIARSVLNGKPYLYGFFLVFLFFTTFGLLNIVVGVIVENTLNVSNNNKKLQTLRYEARLRKELEALREVFEEADTDHSGGVDIEEFHVVMKRTDVQQIFSEMELPFNEPDMLFEIFDTEKAGVLSINAFVDGAIRFKGPPTGFEMRSMTIDVKLIATKIAKIESTLKALQVIPASDADTGSERRSSIPSLRRQGTHQSNSSLSGPEAASPGLRRQRSADSSLSGTVGRDPYSPKFQRQGTHNSSIGRDPSEGTTPDLAKPGSQWPDQPTTQEDENIAKHKQSRGVRLDGIEQTLKGVKQEQSLFAADVQRLLQLARPIAHTMGVNGTTPVNGHAVNGLNGHTPVQLKVPISDGLVPFQDKNELMKYIETQNMLLQQHLSKQEEIMRSTRTPL